MSVVDLQELPAFLDAGQTLAGLDLGTKTIGLSVSDRGLSLATPRQVIMRKKFTQDAEALLAAFKRDNVGGIVIGLPVNMDGSEGPRAQSTRAFIRNLERLTAMPVAFWDERLSTAAAERELIALDTKRAKRARIIDAHAAAHILQGALDRLRAAGQREA